MKLIAHRALFNGPNPENENHPRQIALALDKGFDVEIDVRYIDGKWWLGHDGPDYEVPYSFLSDERMWIHCKNMEALSVLVTDHTKNIFFHDGDDVVLTSKKFLWTYPGKTLFCNSVLVQPEWFPNWEQTILDQRCHAVCSKFVKKIGEMLTA